VQNQLWIINNGCTELTVMSHYQANVQYGTLTGRGYCSSVHTSLFNSIFERRVPTAIKLSQCTVCPRSSDLFFTHELFDLKSIFL